MGSGSSAGRAVQAEVRRLVCKHLDVPEDRVKPEASLVDDLGADSLAFVDLTLVFEETHRGGPLCVPRRSARQGLLARCVLQGP